MKQTCNICGQEIETGGFGGIPMKQHYKHTHPGAYYDDAPEVTTLGEFS
jgi:hypothetical protein